MAMPKNFLPAVIAALYLLLAVTSVQYDDITFDESAHLRYGVQMLKWHPDRYVNGKDEFRSTMPVTALNALPRAAEQILHPGTRKSDWGAGDIRMGRYISILFGLILLWYCYRFAAGLTNAATGCLIMLLVAVDPNVLAHARLVTTDVYGTTAFIATLYHLWRWLAKKDSVHFYYWCIAIAVAQCCKANNILLYFICLLPIIIYQVPAGSSRFLRRGAGRLLVFGVIQIAIINAAWLFSSPWYMFSEYHFKSEFFRSLQSGWRLHIPLPFPKAFTDTYDLVQYERESFDGTAQNYLLGELRYKRGFWNYYLVCYSLKTPLATLLISLSGIAYSLFRRSVRRTALLFGWWPCVLLLVFLSMSSVQNGYRYLLPLTCTCLIFSGFFIDAALRRFRYATLAVCLLIPVATAIYNFHSYISYTNLLIPETKAYLYFADSNLNWGQRTAQVKTFLNEHPGYIFQPDTPVSGHIVVDINYLTGTLQPAQFKWLREHYTPVAVFEHCYLIYDVPKDTTRP